MKITRIQLVLIISFLIMEVLLVLIGDPIISEAVKQYITPEMKSFAKMLSKKGLYPLYGIFLFLFVYALIKKNHKLAKLCFGYLQIQILISFAFVRLLKIVCGRTRPNVGSDFTFFSFESAYNSFPSGHSADAFVSAMFLYYLLKNSKYSAYRHLPILFASMIALSRLAVNAHFASDVLAGTFIGALGAWFYLKNRLEVDKHTPIR